MSECRVELVVGLGNPGKEYSRTRHNIGFMVVDRLADRHKISLKKRRGEIVFGRGEVDGRLIIFAKPMTFMNRSGPGVMALAQFFGLGAGELLVIHDDIDIVFGRIKIKEKGGDGGHKGLKSLIEALGTDVFARVRVGIGRPDTQEDVKEYVLDTFDAGQEKVLDEVITVAQDAVETILLSGLTAGMNRFSGKEIELK